jgi:hypothetical protein
VILEWHDQANDPENMAFGFVRSRTPQLTGRTAALVGSALHVPVFEADHAPVAVPQLIWYSRLATTPVNPRDEHVRATLVFGATDAVGAHERALQIGIFENGGIFPI